MLYACICADASAKLYRPHAYYAAKVAATTPFQIISALVFCFTVYGMAGLRPGARFIWENGIVSTLLSLIAVQVRRWLFVKRVCARTTRLQHYMFAVIVCLPCAQVALRRAGCVARLVLQLSVLDACYCRATATMLKSSPCCCLSPVAAPPQVLHCCAILAPNQDVAFMLSIVWTAIQLLMSNFFITFTEVVFQWLTVLRWLSALYYAFEGLAITEFGGVMYKCDQGLDQANISFLRTLLPKSRFLTMPIVVNGLSHPGADCVADSDAVLKYYGFVRPFRYTFGILFSYLIIVHMITYMCMIIVARRERR